MKQTFLKRSLLLSAVITTAALCASARQPESGYRGFVDLTSRISRHSYPLGSVTNYDPGIATSHGYQFNPWLFVGAGIDFSLEDNIWWSDHYKHHYCFESHKLSIFTEGRTDLQFGKFTPFADIRLGWNACTDGTVYFSPSIGYRFNWGRKVGINVGLGYTLDAYRSEEYRIVQTPAGWSTLIPTGNRFNWTESHFSFRIGIDF